MTRLPSSITLIDYGAGNVASLYNALKYLGYSSILIARTAKDIEEAELIIFPGVGTFAMAMDALQKLGFTNALKKYIEEDRPFMGICVGMQVLFSSSEENPGVDGLNVFPAKVKLFNDTEKSVPHIGWSSVSNLEEYFYFVHSYAVILPQDNTCCSHASKYGDEVFVSCVSKGNVVATQFHPEKSGANGLRLLKAFVERELKWNSLDFGNTDLEISENINLRIIACMDVCVDSSGQVVVTKGSSYDIVDKNSGEVRKFGSPVSRALKYYNDGADEIVFLNISGHSTCVLSDQPMLSVLQEASKSIFVPLTVGGGIRSYEIQNSDGSKQQYSALDVVDSYFRSGADKISISSDAVLAAEEYHINGESMKMKTIQDISKKYGRQAVVISIDPRRIYVDSPEKTNHHTLETTKFGPNGEKYVWYQCTIKGGREARDLDVVQLVKACEIMGVGEFMVNSIDQDGKNSGYDLELLQLVKTISKVPVIASSGAGNLTHFHQAATIPVDACLAAGVFHRGELTVEQVKTYLNQNGVTCRNG